MQLKAEPKHDQGEGEYLGWPCTQGLQGWTMEEGHSVFALGYLLK